MRTQCYIPNPCKINKQFVETVENVCADFFDQNYINRCLIGGDQIGKIEVWIDDINRDNETYIKYVKLEIWNEKQNKFYAHLIKSKTPEMGNFEKYLNCHIDREI